MLNEAEAIFKFMEATFHNVQSENDFPSWCRHHQEFSFDYILQKILFTCDKDIFPTKYKMHYNNIVTWCLLLILVIDYVVKAKDKAHWQKLFSHFCSRAANEEEEIAHKLLGEQFRVSYHHVMSAWNMKSSKCKM